jgi:hypothetical protein
MSLTRRNFVQAASISLLAGAAFPAAFAQTGSEKDETFSPEHLTIFNGVSAETFQRFVGEGFAVSSAGKSLGALTLLSVDARTAAPKGLNVHMVGRVPQHTGQVSAGFTLRFKGSGDQLPQDTYTFRNAGLGSFPLFIVPAGPGVAPPTYTAVFSFMAER